MLRTWFFPDEVNFFLRYESRGKPYKTTFEFVEKQLNKKISNKKLNATVFNKITNTY